MDKPRKFDTPQEGLTKGIELTFDEFLVYENDLVVERIQSNSNQITVSSVRVASMSMRKEILNSNKKSAYSFHLSGNEDLYNAFTLPKLIEDVDLYTRFWPFKNIPSYLKERSKLFQGYQAGYKSRARAAYGGMGVWMYIITGELEFVLYPPTNINRSRLSLLDNGELFEPQSDGSVTLLLKGGHSAVIPPGWIIECNAHGNTFVLSGEFLTLDNIQTQLKCLELDIIHSKGAFNATRDSAFRYLYWFSSAKLLDEPGRMTIAKLPLDDLVYLKKNLDEWRRFKRADIITSDSYAPLGLHLCILTLDFKHLIERVQRHSNCRRKSLKNPKDSVDIVTSQATTDNQSN